MNQHWTDRLSEYIDGELSFTERIAVEKHLATCPACRQILAELHAVVAAAAAEPDSLPARDLWRGIAERMTPVQPGVLTIGTHTLKRAPKRVSFTVAQLLAASIALAVFSSSGVFLALRRSPGEIGSVAHEASANVRPVDARRSESYYDAAIRELEAALEQSRRRLDPMTVKVIEENIRIIDRAIFDARTALERDPANQFLNQHLENTMKRKIELLKRATSRS